MATKKYKKGDIIAFKIRKGVFGYTWNFLLILEASEARVTPSYKIIVLNNFEKNNKNFDFNKIEPLKQLDSDYKNEFIIISILVNQIGEHQKLIKIGELTKNKLEEFILKNKIKTSNSQFYSFDNYKTKILLEYNLLKKYKKIKKIEEKESKRLELITANLKDFIREKEYKTKRQLVAIIVDNSFTKFSKYNLNYLISNILSDSMTEDEKTELLKFCSDLGVYRNVFDKKNKKIYLFSNAIIVKENYSYTLFYYDEITRYSKELIDERVNGIPSGINHRFRISEVNSIYDYVLEFKERVVDIQFLEIFENDIKNRKKEMIKRFPEEKVENSFLFKK